MTYMKQKRLFSKKTAFSAVIASLILMLLAVAAGVVVYAYVMGWIGGATQNPTRTGKLQIDSMAANTSAIRIYIRNVGGVDVVLNKTYVEGTFVANNSAITDSTGALPVQAVAYIELNYTMVKHNFYEVMIVCKDGTAVSGSVEAK
jgi:FlaG/FlaF family flagellin (archaellin)